MKITHIAIAAIIGMGLGVAHQYANAATCLQYSERIEFLAEHRDNGLTREQSSFNITQSIKQLAKHEAFAGVDMVVEEKDWQELLALVYKEPHLTPVQEAAHFLRACRGISPTHRSM